MIRVASHFTFCSPDDIRRRTVIEQNEGQTITRLYSLDEMAVESARTLFYDGILSAEIISIKEHTTNIANLLADYNYVDLSNGIPPAINGNGNPLILDFGTGWPEKINKQMPGLTAILDTFSIFEIIAACCYFPALALGKTATLGTTRQTSLLLWEGADLINQKITGQTKVRTIS